MTDRTPSSPGLLICFEGIDGAGKSTQIRLLAERLRAAGLDVVVTKEPTDGPHGSRVRASAVTGRMDPREELRVLMDDRREHVTDFIHPALAAGQVVIMDRYFWSSMAYQGSILGDPDGILAANLAFAPLPDLTLFLDVPVDSSQSRIISRDGKPNNFERSDFLTRCRDIFLGIRHPSFVRVDGNRAPAEVARDVLDLVIRTAIARDPSSPATQALRALQRN